MPGGSGTCNQMLSAATAFSPLQDKGSGKGSLGCKLWPLDKHVDFDHQHAWKKSAAPSPSTLKPKDVKYSVKVCCQTWRFAISSPCTNALCSRVIHQTMLT